MYLWLSFALSMGCSGGRERKGGRGRREGKVELVAVQGPLTSTREYFQEWLEDIPAELCRGV